MMSLLIGLEIGSANTAAKNFDDKIRAWLRNIFQFELFDASVYKCLHDLFPFCDWPIGPI